MEGRNVEKIYEHIENAYSLPKTEETCVFDCDLSEEEKLHIRQQAIEFLKHFEQKNKNEIRESLEKLTFEEVEALENSSRMLEVKIRQLESTEESESSEISKSLLKLSETVAKIDPRKHDLSSKGFWSFLPFLTTPLRRYLKKFRSASEMISEIIENLNEGEKLLRNDNIVLTHDKERYKEAALQLQKKALMMQHMIDAIESSTEYLDKQEREFYLNNLVLHLQKKIRNIYEILLVTQEGFLSNDFIINTNWELIDNIRNVRTVTKKALDIGVAMLVAMENQKSVLDAVEKTKEVTNDLLVNNAKRLNEQGARIYAQSGQATLNTQSLQEAFEQIDQAIGKINTLKSEALAYTKAEVDTLRTISEKLAQKIEDAQKIEQIRAVPVE